MLLVVNIFRSARGGGREKCETHPFTVESMQVDNNNKMQTHAHSRPHTCDENHCK